MEIDVTTQTQNEVKNTTQEPKETIVLDTTDKPKIKNKPGRKPKTKQIARFRIIDEPVLMTFN